MTYREVWNWGKEILRHAGIPEADLDAWFLLEYVTGMTKTQYYVRSTEGNFLGEAGASDRKIGLDAGFSF